MGEEIIMARPLAPITPRGSGRRQRRKPYWTQALLLPPFAIALAAIATFVIRDLFEVPRFWIWLGSLNTLMLFVYYFDAFFAEMRAARVPDGWLHVANLLGAIPATLVAVFLSGKPRAHGFKMLTIVIGMVQIGAVLAWQYLLH